ncbi:ANTAR domain-containing response regulator [Leeia oryzae]|uniref:ANTAR domain-containing response regulator n=1 Tax=Leeia oryzae TaxID=356662 RepID=UPI000369FC19|nr:ANTAR domain-containing protein [Leeia oryzae]
MNDTDKHLGTLRPALEAVGYEVIAEVSSVRALLHAVEAQMPDVVIIDTESPSRDTLEQLSVMHASAPRPVVMFSDEADQAVIRSAVASGVTAYIVDGLTPSRLAPILEVAKARFDEERQLRERLASAEQQLADRKIIEKAKGILMQKRQLTEPEAYELMRKQAMKQGVKLGEVARQLVAMADLL